MRSLSLPDYGSNEWASIPQAHRNEIRQILRVIAEAPERGRTAYLERAAQDVGISFPTLRTKFYAIQNGGHWTVLIDKRQIVTTRAKANRTASLPFINHLLKLVENNKRCSAPAIKGLYRSWRVRDKIIPGYEDWPGWPKMPDGWSMRNLAKIIKRETNLAAMRSVRIGTSSKTNPYLTTVLTSRTKLWPGAIVQLDDQWHDNYVTLGTGKNLQVVRALELGALDVFSAHRFHWGCKPRRRRENGSMENIGGKDARLFVGGLMHRFGHSPMGTMLMVEHETMSISEDIERILYDSTRGMLRVDRQPIEGKQAALSGFWSGSEGGNFRAKACLESTHNLIRNDAGSLPMQTGSFSSGIQTPVNTARQLAYIERIMRDVMAKVPHRAHLLRLPTLDFHSQFIPFLTDYYHFGLASRTDHNLEGWEALNHVITEYTAAPGSDHWMNEAEFLKLPEDSQLILTSAIRSAPAKWSRRRRLSPLEVWNRRPDFCPLGPAVICEILTKDLAREVTAFRGFLTFQDEDFAPEPLIYTARFISGPRRGNEIGHGEKVLMFANPYNDETALAVDGQGRFIGELPLYERITTINRDAFNAGVPFDVRPEIRSEELKRAAGEKHSRIADILEPVRIRHTQEVSEARDLREHNRRVLSGEPVTPDEIHQSRVAAGQQAHRTAAANRLQTHGNAFDSDASYQPDAEIRSAWDDLPDDAPLPDAF